MLIPWSVALRRSTAKGEPLPFLSPPSSFSLLCNGDGVVNGADLGLLLVDFGGSGAADLNGDGIVNGADLGLMLVEWR